MEPIFNYLQNHFPVLINYKYLFLFLGGTFEGLNTIVLGGFLASINAVKTLPMFVLFVIGYCIEGYMWYFVGYFAGAKPIDKWIKKDAKGKRVMEKVEYYFHRYSGRAIIITKLTFSLTIATLIMAGSLKFNLRKFHLYNFIGSVGWVGMVFSIGYFFGESYKLFVVYLKHFTYGLIFLGGAMALVYILKLLLGSVFIKTLFITDKLREIKSKIKDGLDQFLSNDYKD